jgi:hypothetical protein
MRRMALERSLPRYLQKPSHQSAQEWNHQASIYAMSQQW